MRVYVSGPYTAPDPVENTHKAILAADELMDNGFIPYVPHLTMTWHLVKPRPYEDWMTIDLAFVEVCDAVLRIPGASSGGDREVTYAQSLGIPVYHSIVELLAARQACSAAEAFQS